MQAEPPVGIGGGRDLVLGGDHHRCGAERIARILVDRGLQPARHHQPDMGAVGHPIGVQGALDGRHDMVPAQADVEIDRPRPSEQPVQVRLEEQQPALVQPQAFPDPVAKGEPRVEHRHHRLGARDQRAVHIDEHIRVAGIGGVVLASGHRSELAPGAARVDRPAQTRDTPGEGLNWETRT